MSSAKLGFNTHGKSRVRMVKVKRLSDGRHEVMQLSVQILLEGDGMENVFLTSDNATVIATDTCKNTVYCLGKMHDFDSIEDFGMIICRHFLAEYPTIVNRICVEIIKDRWERIANLDSKGRLAPHNHVFKRLGPNRPFTHVQGEKRRSSALKLSIQSGFTNLEIMKTTQSGFEGFHRDRFTSLAEVADRLVGTSITAKWDYNTQFVGGGGGGGGGGRQAPVDYNRISNIIENALVNTFAGPADEGTYSASVQQTLFEMGKAAIDATREIDQISLNMPNIHNIPFNLEPYGFPKEKGPPTIFFPIDEPHGMIKATITRTSSSGKPRARL